MRRQGFAAICWVALVVTSVSCNESRGKESKDGNDSYDVQVSFSSNDAIQAVERELDRSGRKVTVRRRVTRSKLEWVACSQIDFDLGRCRDADRYPPYGRKQVSRSYSEWVTERVPLPSSARFVATQVTRGTWSVQAEFTLDGASLESVWDVRESGGATERAPAD